LNRSALNLMPRDFRHRASLRVLPNPSSPFSNLRAHNSLCELGSP